MFDIGFFELLLIGIVGLLVLGPERLPKAARTAGLWVGRIKRSVSTMQREITSQLEAEELRQKLAEQQKKLDEGVNRARRNVEESVGSQPRKRETATSDTAAPASAAEDNARPDSSQAAVRAESPSAARDDSQPATGATSTNPKSTAGDTSSSADKDSASR